MSNDNRDVEMQDEYDFSQAQQGAAIPTGHGKTRITIRVDNDILDWFRKQVHKQGGGNYQTMINEALRTHIQRLSSTDEGADLLRLEEVVRHSASAQTLMVLRSLSRSGNIAFELHQERKHAESQEDVPTLKQLWVGYEKGTLRELVRELVREELERTR